MGGEQSGSEEGEIGGRRNKGDGGGGMGKIRGYDGAISC